MSLLDLTAAFDTVDHGILLRRLETIFGFHGAILQWLGSYLAGRTQSVMLNCQSTVAQTVVFGVPQGSVLGPLLFTLYTADIGKVIQHYGPSHHSYADDNQLYASCISSESAALKTKMIRCIDSVGEWMASNWLMLNLSKSGLCGAPPHIASISSTDLRSPFRVSIMMRNLRAHFEECMSMEEHVNRLLRSCFYQRRRIRFIRRALSICGGDRVSRTRLS